MGDSGSTSGVADTAAAATANQPLVLAGAQEERPHSAMESFISITKSLMIRALIIYFITSLFRRGQTPNSSTTNNSNSAMAVVSPALNLFPDGTPITLHLYLSEAQRKQDQCDFGDPTTQLFWQKEDLTYGDWVSGDFNDGSYVHEKDLLISDGIRNNGSLFLYAFVTRAGDSPNPKDSNYADAYMGYGKKQLNRYKQLKSSVTKNLLTGVSDKTPVEDGKIVSHWHPNITVNVVTDQTQWTYGSVPAPLDQFVRFTVDAKHYKPIVFTNDYWNMARDYKPLNESEPFRLRVTFQPLSLFKWQLYAAQSMRQMWNVWGDSGEESDEEQDTLKETLLDTNPYLLAVTIFVSILHSVFELLAFKNDIQFWKDRNSLEGLSVRTVFFSVFQSLVVLLYVLDNDTNTLVRISCFIGLAIELWKIYKVVDIRIENGRITFKDKGSYVESSTKMYDNLAFKYLSWLCFPLLVGYMVYALMYMEHKGWYSFVLDLLYGYLLTFGFIMMTPQLFINYKLKSVAHLPWRMLTYKFLNTFIDDMFAFVIKMPTMYRLGCFRDDIVFLVFLYQRWMYPVDKTRRNEYGYTEADATAVATVGEEQQQEKTKKDQ